ncbi:MAG: hypothetical protein D6682_02200 [Zetaproteobacteria bacterium]|nr:MAG: hypothetical protein D6682_02200 [Zetaproteobacteria bacterium]
MSGDFVEQRRHFRPPAPLPGLTARMDAVMEMLAKRRRWNLIAHGVVVGFTLLCIAAIWWSLSVRLPQLHRSTAALRQLGQAYSRLEQLKLAQNRLLDRGVAQSMRRHERELFADQREVVDWLHAEIATAGHQGIALRYRLGAVRPALGTHRSMDLHLQLRDRRGAHGFSRLIGFVSRMRHHGVALHIDKLQATGSGHGMEALELSARVWMR